MHKEPNKMRHAFSTPIRAVLGRATLFFFLATAVLIYVVVYVCALCSLKPLPRAFAFEIHLRLSMALCFLPAFTTAAVALLINSVSPRVLFATSSRHRLAPMLRGLATAATGIGLTAIAVTYLERRLPDEGCVILGAAASTAIGLLLCRRTRPGHCANCGYDITRSIAFGRCPECGTPLTEGSIGVPAAAVGVATTPSAPYALRAAPAYGRTRKLQ